MSGDYGYFIVPRGSLDHPAFDPGQPFCRGRAWVWLLERAAWRPRMIDVCGRTVLIERGQLCYSLASLAKAWNWPIGKVRRFIERLKTDTKVDTVADPGRLLITICNYDQIQSSTGRAPAQAGMDGDMPATRQQHDDDTLFKKGKPSKKEIKESDPSGLVPQRPEIDAVARPESTRSIALGRSSGSQGDMERDGCSTGAERGQRPEPSAEAGPDPKAAAVWGAERLAGCIEGCRG